MKSQWGTRVPELDGIRAIAIWMVLLLHILVFENHVFLFLPHAVREVIGHGWLGVDLFFLLSGFLITGILLDTKERPSYFKNFYIRRFLRIMPLYFAVVIVWSFAYRGYGHYFELSSGFGANLAPLFHIRVPHGPDVLWSLAVEEHFYLLWPAVVFLLDRRKVLTLCAVLFLGSPILRGIFAAKGMNPQLIYQLTWFRLDGLAAGAAMAIWARSELFTQRNTQILVAILMVLLCVISVAGLPFHIFGTATPAAVSLRYTQAYLLFGTFFLLTLAYRQTKWTAFLRNPFMQLSGALSYCLYLVHFSVGDLFQSLFNHQHALSLRPDALALTRGAFMIVVSFSIALLSRRYLEAPLLALKDKFAAQKPVENPQLLSTLNPEQING
jgi:peptidoglycan/LPS O-acetylase OafA/YrhL